MMKEKIENNIYFSPITRIVSLILSILIIVVCILQIIGYERINIVFNIIVSMLIIDRYVLKIK